MPKDCITFVDMFDWEKDSNEHEQKLLEGINTSEGRLPARIVVKIKFEEDDDQTNKRTFSRTSEKRLES
jgi:hypothetical protein